MNSAVRTTATERVPTDSMRKTALAGGVLYLITFIASIPAVFLLQPVSRTVVATTAGAA